MAPTDNDETDTMTQEPLFNAAWKRKHLSAGVLLASLAAISGCSGTLEGDGSAPFGSGPEDPFIAGPVAPSVTSPESGGSVTPSPNDGQPPVPAGEPTTPPGPGNPNMPGPSGEPGDPSELAEPELDPGRTVLRRLTAPEYNNTVRDLMLTTTHPADNFTAADTVADEGFDTIGAVLTLPPVLFDQYESAATTLVDELFARPIGDSARATILTCEGTDDACARSVLETFATRAYRRPVEPAEVDDLMALKARADELELPPEEGLKAALKAVLISPHFIFRVEQSNVGDATAEPLTQYELATRLSYFLWSSMPDADLMAAAEAGTLSANLSAQVQRMLDDDKAHAFAVNFAGQWLNVRHMEEHEPPSQLVFPQYDDALRDAAKAETLAFFEALYTEGRPVTELLTADYTMANARLAEHYGIGAPPSGDLERVSLTQTPRRGFLTQASFLISSSHPGSTSPARRGKMVLERFMCAIIQPAPPDAETELPVPDPGTTRREQLAVHRDNPQCAVCHDLMDPIGFGFENFDAIGTYRTEENGGMIDASGTLPPAFGGSSFDTPAELAQLLAADERFISCVTEKLLTYGVGRSFEGREAKAYTSALAQEGIAEGKTDWRSLLEHVVSSDAFLTRRGEAQ